MLKNGWQRVKAEDIAEERKSALATGPFGSAISSKFFQDAGVPVIRGSNLSQDTGCRLIDEDLAFVSEEKAEEFERSVAHRGDLVFTCWGTIDQVGLIDERSKYERYIVSNKQMKFTPDSEKAESLFLYYFFSSPQIQSQILAEGIGSSVPGFNLGQLRNFLVLLPPLPEQRAIASILGALDDKIELNRRMNATLESLARAIFKSWFVDFDPVKVKAGQMPTGSYDPTVLDLFPSTFQDSELGPIPEGWNLEKLGDHVTVTRGLSYKGSGLADAGVPIHNLNSVYEGGGYKHDGIKYYTGEYRERHEVVPGDLIVTNTEQGFEHLLIGYAALIPEQFGNHGIFSHHIYRVRKIEESCLTPHYLLHLINSPRCHRWIAGFSNGTTVNMLPMDALQKPLLVVPPAELVEHFTELARNTADKIDDSITESQYLASARDALLPRLLSGDLPVDGFQAEQ